MHNSPEARPTHRGSAAGLVVLRVPELDGMAPMDAAEAFRDLPGLALLESARPGRTGRWSYLTADPLAVVDAPSDGADPFAEARSMLARLGGDPAGDTRPTAEPAPPSPPRRRSRAASSASWATTSAGGSSGCRPSPGWTSTSRPSGSASTTGRSPGTGAPGPRGWRRGRWTATQARLRGEDRRGARTPRWPRPAARSNGRRRPLAAPTAFTSLTSHDAWVRDVEAVREAIAHGDIYQANLTRRLEAPFDGDPWPVFRRLRTGDPALFAGFLDIGPSPANGRPRALLSASPEPFLSVDGQGLVSTDPIKGTRPRGRTREQDRALARELLASPKDQAENVMIVDVLRNDLGRVCEPGSVRVPRLLRLERTAAVQHLVTTVTGQLRPDADAFDLLAAAFPGGSITGAPKIRAMELIERLEPVRRGPYCGTMLWLGPDGRMGSSILIRTFVADGERLTLHVGGGITWRSDPQEEWDETIAKARGPLSSIGAVEVRREHGRSGRGTSGSTASSGRPMGRTCPRSTAGSSWATASSRRSGRAAGA